jgi:hypothetical protein
VQGITLRSESRTTKALPLHLLFEVVLGLRSVPWRPSAYGIREPVVQRFAALVLDRSALARSALECGFRIRHTGDASETKATIRILDPQRGHQREGIGQVNEESQKLVDHRLRVERLEPFEGDGGLAQSRSSRSDQVRSCQVRSWRHRIYSSSRRSNSPPRMQHRPISL